MVKISKNSIAIISFIILLLIFIGAFSSSYSYQNMFNLAYVLAIGVDTGEKAISQTAGKQRDCPGGTKACRPGGQERERGDYLASAARSSSH